MGTRVTGRRLSPAAASTLHLVAFAAGGPAHVMLLGLLLAGVAVTAGLQRLLPRWMMDVGLVVAALAELSWLALVFPPASVLLPVSHFPALAWLIAAGALLPRALATARPPSSQPIEPLTPAGVGRWLRRARNRDRAAFTQTDAEVPLRVAW